MVALVKETKGEIFIKKIEKAKSNKGHIFSLLLDTLQNEYPQAEAVSMLIKSKILMRWLITMPAWQNFKLPATVTMSAKQWKISAQ